MNYRLHEWLRRYVAAELLGSVLALMAAWFTFIHSHSYIAAAGAGLAGEGAGFYGFFVAKELWEHGKRYRDKPLLKRFMLILASSSTNLLVEFAPAELLDNLIVRPFAMYLVPQYIKPYGAGFLLGKFSADAIFYILAVAGYETKKRWLPRSDGKL